MKDRVQFHQITFGFLAAFPLMGLYWIVAEMKQHGVGTLGVWFVMLWLVLFLLWRVFYRQSSFTLRQVFIGTLVAVTVTVGGYLLVLAASGVGFRD